MPRRISDYADAFSGWNFISSIGSIVSVAATALFLHIVYLQLVAGKAIFGYAWTVPQLFSDYLRILKDRSAPGLEWALHNPPKPHAFTSLPLQSTLFGLSEIDKLIKINKKTIKGTATDDEIRWFIQNKVRITSDPAKNDIWEHHLATYRLENAGEASRNLLPIITIGPLFELPFLVTILTGIAAMLGGPFAYVIVFVQGLIQAYRLYKLPTRVMWASSILVKLYNKVKNINVYEIMMISALGIIFISIFIYYLDFSVINLDAPRAWGLYFQDSASPQMEALVELHE